MFFISLQRQMYLLTLSLKQQNENFYLTTLSKTENSLLRNHVGLPFPDESQCPVVI